MKFLRILNIFILIQFISCSTIENPYIEFEKLGIQIINNPETLQNIEYFYPNYYNEDYLNYEMKDSVYIQNIIKEINEFNKNSKNYKLAFHLTVSNSVRDEQIILNKLKYKMKGNINSLDEIFEFDLTNHKYEGFAFRFIQKGSKCYLNTIYKTHFPN